MTESRAKFRWAKEHQNCFKELIEAFKKDVSLHYFDIEKPTFVFTDTHKTGLGAMLAQKESKSTAKPMTFASITTGKAEYRYPQLDIEAMGVVFGLRRFCHYLLARDCQTRQQLYLTTNHYWTVIFPRICPSG